MKRRAVGEVYLPRSTRARRAEDTETQEAPGSSQQLHNADEFWAPDSSPPAPIESDVSGSSCVSSSECDTSSDSNARDEDSSEDEEEDLAIQIRARVSRILASRLRHEYEDQVDFKNFDTRLRAAVALIRPRS